MELANSGGDKSWCDKLKNDYLWDSTRYQDASNSEDLSHQEWRIGYAIRNRQPISSMFFEFEQLTWTSLRN